MEAVWADDGLSLEESSTPNALELDAAPVVPQPKTLQRGVPATQAASPLKKPTLSEGAKQPPGPIFRARWLGEVMNGDDESLPHRDVPAFDKVEQMSLSLLHQTSQDHVMLQMPGTLQFGDLVSILCQNSKYLTSQDFLGSCQVSM